MCGQDQKWIWLFRCWDSKICCISRILSWCFACWYTFRKVKSYFNNCWVGMVKNGQGLIYHGILKLSLSHKWFEELSRLIEWFLDADSDGMIFWFDCQSTIYLWHLRVLRDYYSCTLTDFLGKILFGQKQQTMIENDPKIGFFYYFD